MERTQAVYGELYSDFYDMVFLFPGHVSRYSDE